MLQTKATASEKHALQRQHERLKGETKGAVLLFRMGNGYAAFYEDAVTVADVVGVRLPHGIVSLSLTPGLFSRTVGYLTGAGLRVALCDQGVAAWEAQ